WLKRRTNRQPRVASHRGADDRLEKMLAIKVAPGAERIVLAAVILKLLKQLRCCRDDSIALIVVAKAVGNGHIDIPGVLTLRAVDIQKLLVERVGQGLERVLKVEHRVEN